MNEDPNMLLPRKAVEAKESRYFLKMWERYWHRYYTSLKRKRKEGVKNAEEQTKSTSPKP